MKTECIICHVIFDAERITRKYCSNKCMCKASYDRNYKKIYAQEKCKFCYKTYQKERSTGQFCSVICGKKYNYHKRHLELKNKTLEMYGGKCSCCGELRREFLTLEHKMGGGRAHRKHKSSNGIFIEITNTYQPELYTILCMNCNHSRGINGYCPHEREMK